MIKLKTYLASLLIVGCCVFFSGCPKIDFGTERIMSPPIISAEQEGRKAALKRYVTEKLKEFVADPKLVYPAAGTHVMPYIEDWGTDGKRTVFVLFSLKSKERVKETIKIGMYKEVNGSWEIADCKDISSVGGIKLEDISIRQMKKDANKNILVSYSVLGRAEKTLTIWEYDDAGIREAVPKSINFFDKVEADIDDDGCIEVVYIRRPKKGGKGPTIQRLKLGDSQSRSMPLMGEVDRSSQDADSSNMVINRLEGKRSIIFVNEKIYDEDANSLMMATEVIEYRDNSFFNKTYWGDQESGRVVFDKIDFTLRDERIELCDIDGDGCLEVPKEVRSDQPDEEDLKVIEWYSFCAAEPELRAKTFENLATPYRLVLPKKWWSIAKEESEFGGDGGPKVVYEIQRKSKGSSNLLIIKDAGTKRELLAIYVRPVGWKPKKDTYEEFGRTKDCVYFVWLPDEPDAAGISKVQLQELLKIGV